jgi:prevent-host-death family protein
MAIMAMRKGPPLMRSANIAELRDRLTHYLREVRAGQEIIVRDRQRPIAKIVPLAVDDDADDTALVAAGLMRKAQRPLPAAFWRPRRAAVTVRTAVAALRADRADR